MAHTGYSAIQDYHYDGAMNEIFSAKERAGAWSGVGEES